MIIDDEDYHFLLQQSIEMLNEKKKFTKSYKMSRALLDIDYFEVNSWLKKSQSEKYLIYGIRSKQTLVECQNNLRSSNGRIQILYELGDREYTLANFESSLKYFQNYLQYRPNCKQTQIQIAKLQYRLGNISDAEQKVLQFLHAHDAAVDNDNAYNANWIGNFNHGDELNEISLLVLYSLMVQIQYELKNQDKLIDYISRILNLSPNDSFALIYLADLLMGFPDKRDYAIAQLKMLRQKIYNERNDFTKQTFQDLVNILEKYNDVILRE